MFVQPHNRAISRAASPIPSSSISPSSDLMKPYSTDFEIERLPKSLMRLSMPLAGPGYDSNVEFRDCVSRLLEATNAPFTVSGRITLEVSQLALFFRTKTGLTHSLDFPVDVDYNIPPSLEVLLETCRPHQAAESIIYPERPSLLYPAEIPVTFSLDLANHPILDAVRNTLFPNLPSGHHLSARRDKLEIIDTGSRLLRQQHSLRQDGRAATVIITLPSRFEGGTLVVHNHDGIQERYIGRGGKIDEIEWTAFLPDCDYEIEPVQRGCRISITYGVFLRSFGAGAPDSLIRPSDDYLDRLGSVLNLSRGRKIGFHLEFDYSVNPAESLADSVVPWLRGGDSLLYHAIKLFKLAPELHWTAGGYIWPIDRSVDFVRGDIAEGHPLRRHVLPAGVLPDVHHDPLSRRLDVPPVRGPFNITTTSPFNDAEEEEASNLRVKIEDNGAIPIAKADISVLKDWSTTTAVAGKQRVYFVSGGELEKLVVNILLVVFIP
ncbi:hypothetical protein C0991_001346 [Blastosporella zonata]|nr:hypothetical protein C0991_001346 [Blastosporella zonata]